MTTIISPQIVRIILYVKDVPQVAAFYKYHFNMQQLPGSSAGWAELSAIGGGCNIALHQASVAQKSGAAIKIAFGVANIKAFIVEKEAEGLTFGPIHKAENFEFANAKDPAGNSIQISSRGLPPIG